MYRFHQKRPSGESFAPSGGLLGWTNFQAVVRRGAGRLGDCGGFTQGGVGFGVSPSEDSDEEVPTSIQYEPHLGHSQVSRGLAVAGGSGSGQG